MQTQLQHLKELAKQSRINHTVVKVAVGFMNSESQENLIGNWEFTNSKSNSIQKSISRVTIEFHRVIKKNYKEIRE